MDRWWLTLKSVNRYIVKCKYENDDCGIDLFVDACDIDQVKQIMQDRFPTYRVMDIKDFFKDEYV